MVKVNRLMKIDMLCKHREVNTGQPQTIDMLCKHIQVNKGNPTQLTCYVNTYK